MKLKNNFVLILLLALLNGCYEKTEGCLDVHATNFDLDADVACVDCCEFPYLKLQVKNTISLLDSVYLDGNDQPFRYKSIRYFLSDFRLMTSTGGEVQVDQPIGITVLNDLGVQETLNFADDFIIVNAASSPVISIGTFTHPETFVGVKFKVGLDPILDTAKPDDFLPNHALSKTEDGMYDEENLHYFSAKIEIFKDTIAQDTIPRLLTSFVSQGALDVYLPFDDPTILPEGFNLTISLAVDGVHWLESSDVRSDTETKLMNDVFTKLPNSFAVSGVTIK